MPDLYPEIEPYAQRMLEVTGGDLIYWEVCGHPGGKPAVVLHGGPGSGCTPWQRRLFDLLHTALCCVINVVVGGAGLMRAPLKPASETNGGAAI